MKALLLEVSTEFWEWCWCHATRLELWLWDHRCDAADRLHDYQKKHSIPEWRGPL